MNSRILAAGAVAGVAVLVGVFVAPGLISPTKATPEPIAPELCAYHFEAIDRSGKLFRDNDSSMGVVDIAALDISMTFPDGSPDPELALASHNDGRRVAGWKTLEAQKADKAGYHLEKAGDPEPVYMRDGPVLKIGNSWFVGDRAQFGRDIRHIDLSVDSSFMDLFQTSRSFEIWWRGERRLTLNIVPEKVSPERFSLGCLPLSAEQRKRMEGDGYAMRKLSPAPAPRLMDFYGRSPHMNGNPFNVDDTAAGSATFRVTVGPDGLVKQCDMPSHQGEISSRQGACEQLRDHARFYPATDANDAPTAAEASLTLDWSGRPKG